MTRWLLEPIPPFTWIGLTLSTFDVAAALRLCVVLRQLRELFVRLHCTGKTEAKDIEESSMAKTVATALVVVYGGEAVMGEFISIVALISRLNKSFSAPWLGVSPSFLYSPTIPLLYSGLTIVTELLPWVPPISMCTELPLSFFDGLTRAFLLCQLIPPVVTNHIKPEFSTSPWTLLLSSLVRDRASRHVSVDQRLTLFLRLSQTEAFSSSTFFPCFSRRDGPSRHPPNFARMDGPRSICGVRP